MTLQPLAVRRWRLQEKCTKTIDLHTWLFRCCAISRVFNQHLNPSVTIYEYRRTAELAGPFTFIFWLIKAELRAETEVSSTFVRYIDGWKYLSYTSRALLSTMDDLSASTSSVATTYALKRDFGASTRWVERGSRSKPLYTYLDRVLDWQHNIIFGKTPSSLTCTRAYRCRIALHGLQMWQRAMGDQIFVAVLGPTLTSSKHMVARPGTYAPYNITPRRFRYQSWSMPAISLAAIKHPFAYLECLRRPSAGVCRGLRCRSC